MGKKQPCAKAMIYLLPLVGSQSRLNVYVCSPFFAFRWKASNYSQFYGMSLDEGIRYRLGTQRPSRTIMNMNEIQVQDCPCSCVLELERPI